MPVVSMQPERQLCGSAAGVGIGLGVSPFAQRGLDEALGLAVCFGGVGLGADVFELEARACPAEDPGSVTGAVVGHDTLDLDAQAGVVGDGGFEKGCSASLALVGLDLGEGDARGIVDADMDELPAAAARGGGAGLLAGDAMADAVELAELFDVDVDQLAGVLAFIAAHRLGGLQGAQPVEAQPLEDGLRRRSVQMLGPRAAILQAGQAFALIALDPFAHRARANAYGFTDGPRRLPTENHFDHALSTKRRQAGILMDVHPALPRTS